MSPPHYLEGRLVAAAAVEETGVAEGQRVMGMVEYPLVGAGQKPMAEEYQEQQLAGSGKTAYNHGLA